MNRFSKYCVFIGGIMVLVAVLVAGGYLMGFYSLSQLETENVSGLMGLGAIIFFFGLCNPSANKVDKND